MKKLTVYTTAEKAFEFEVTEDVARGVIETCEKGDNFKIIDSDFTVPQEERRTVAFISAHVVAIEVEG